MMVEGKPGHAGGGLQALQGVTLARQVLVGRGCGWEPCAVIPKSNCIPFYPMAVPYLHPLRRGLHLSSTPETLSQPQSLGWFRIPLGKPCLSQQREYKVEAPSQHMNALQGKALVGILMTSILFPVNFVLILGTNTGNE